MEKIACEKCKYSNKKALHIHHKDRNHKNNSKDNLMVICSNCHQIEHYQENIDRLNKIRGMTIMIKKPKIPKSVKKHNCQNYRVRQ